MTGAQLAPVVPEIFVALAAMALLMLGVFRGDGATLDHAVDHPLLVHDYSSV